MGVVEIPKLSLNIPVIRDLTIGSRFLAGNQPSDRRVGHALRNIAHSGLVKQDFSPTLTGELGDRFTLTVLDRTLKLIKSRLPSGGRSELRVIKDGRWQRSYLPKQHPSPACPRQTGKKLSVGARFPEPERSFTVRLFAIRLIHRLRHPFSLPRRCALFSFGGRRNSAPELKKCVKTKRDQWHFLLCNIHVIDIQNVAKSIDFFSIMW